MLTAHLLAATAEPGVNAGFGEIPWTVVISLLVNGAMLAYVFGGLTQKIKAVEMDVSKTQIELEKMRDTNKISADNLHRIEIMLSKIETRFDMFLTAAAEGSKCPLLKDSVAKNNHKTAGA